MTEEYLTTKEACELLKINRNTIAAWREAGKIEGFKAGRTYRYKRTDLEALLSGEREETIRASEVQSCKCCKSEPTLWKAKDTNNPDKDIYRFECCNESCPLNPFTRWYDSPREALKEWNSIPD